MSSPDVLSAEVLLVDIDRPIPALPCDDSLVNRHKVLLARLHGHVLGAVNISIPPAGISSELVASALWDELAPKILGHGHQHPLAPIPTTLPSGGLDVGDAGECWNTPALQPLVSVVIATKGRPLALERCLPTLLDQTHAAFEIVVVENGTTGDALTTMLDRRFPMEERIRYFRETEAGTSLARNRGIAEARGSIVAFTDDDVLADPNWLKALVAAFSRHDVECVTGLVIPAKMTAAAERWFEEYGGFSKGYEQVVFTKHRKRGSPLLYPYTAGSFGSGNNAAFRRDFLIRTGGFDLRLGPGTPTHAGEDLDAFLAVVMNEGAIAYEPDAVIRHFHRDDIEGLGRQLRNYGVGLTAVFTKWALRDRHTAFDILARVPLGIWMVLDPRSAKNRKKSKDFPRSLWLAEIAGMAFGPLAYARSAMRARRAGSVSVTTSSGASR